MTKKLICGVGINDADYMVSPVINGNQIRCAYYSVWKSMIERCYSRKYQEKFTSYIGCSVCEEWLTFSKFKAWMERQDWKGKHLDKDILTKDGKIYSPETCVFINGSLNSFITECKSNKGLLPVGVSFHKGNKSFIVRCSNPISGLRDNLGYFNCESAAYAAWKNKKFEFACQLADLQSDERVAKALRVRYL